MSEFYLLLRMMTESRHKWPVPPERPAVVATASPSTPLARLNPKDAEALRAALERSVACMTGTLVKLPDSPLYVPVIDDGCIQKALAAEKGK